MLVIEQTAFFYCIHVSFIVFIQEILARIQQTLDNATVSESPYKCQKVTKSHNIRVFRHSETVALSRVLGVLDA